MKRGLAVGEKLDVSVGRGVSEQKPTHIISTATASYSFSYHSCSFVRSVTEQKPKYSATATTTAAVVLQGVVRGVTGQKPTHTVLQLQLQ